MIAALLLLAVFALSALIAEKCLQMVVNPVRYDVDYVKALETTNGFSDCIEAFETKWQRTPFVLHCAGADISGEYMMNPADSGTPRKVAIICHGHTVNRYSDLKYADIFYRAGFSTVIFDERYFGESTGDFCTLGQNEARDVAAIIAYVRQIFGQDCVIGLHGESMGAATALLTLKYETPDFVIADCPFADSKLLFAQWLKCNLHIPIGLIWPILRRRAKRKYDYDVESVCPIAAVQGKNVPICLMHGKSDNLIPYTHSEMLHKACVNPNSELHLFENADHARSIVMARTEYERLVLAFLHNCGLYGTENKQ